MPTIMMMPIEAFTDSGVPVIHSAVNTPMRPIGTDTMMMSGSTSERNCDAITM